MIELRWLDKEIPFEVDAEHGSTYTDYAHERVLQYRYWTAHRVCDCWSDWIDVPEVSGE